MAKIRRLTRQIVASRPVSDTYPDTEAQRCISIVVPDDDSYVQLLAGLYALATNYWNWDGSDADNNRRAEMMLDAYTATDWEGCMDCAGVADCIENDETVQAAIDARIEALYQPTSPATPMPVSVSGANLVPDTGCDLDELWGAVDNLIENMNVNNQDMQQIFESVSNLGERTSKLIAGIPVIGQLPIDEAIDYVQTLLTNDVFEAYAAADTTAYRNEIKCDLFCIAKTASCVLSLDDVGTYFSDRLGSAWSDTFTDILLFLTAGVWTGTEINDTFYLLQVAALGKSNKFFSMLGLPSFATYMATGIASDDWEILCACAGFCRSTYDDATPPASLSITIGTADATGFIESADLAGTEYVIFTCDQSEAGSISRVRMVFADNAEKASQIFVNGGTFIKNGTPVEIYGEPGIYELTCDLSPSEAGNFEGILVRQLIGVTDTFKLLRVEVVYEC